MISLSVLETSDSARSTIPEDRILCIHLEYVESAVLL